MSILLCFMNGKLCPFTYAHLASKRHLFCSFFLQMEKYIKSIYGLPTKLYQTSNMFVSVIHGLEVFE